MIAVIVCLLALLILQLATPFWWWIMLVPFAYGVAAAGTARKTVGTGFAAAGLLWLGAGLYSFLTGSGRIARRMASLFGIGNPWLLILATGLVAGIAAAVSAYAGYAVRTLLKVRPAGPKG
jgi:hypothetical protein